MRLYEEAGCLAREQVGGAGALFHTSPRRAGVRSAALRWRSPTSEPKATPPHPRVQVCNEAREAIASALPPHLVGSASVMAEGD